MSNQKAQKKSYRAEREFGLIVGGMLLLIGGWWLYRGTWKTAAPVLLGIGGLLIALGAIFPRALVVPNRLWMELARVLSLVTTPIILGLVYFLIFTPVGVVKRLFGWDPLRRRAPSSQPGGQSGGQPGGQSGGSYWVPYNARQQDPRHFEKMF